MKKVIALALALVMVCTMAFAATIIVPGAGTAVTTPAGTYGQLVPGSKLHFTLADLDGTTGAYYNPTTGEFVPANNKVVVTFGKGAELVKSQGWVRTVAKVTGDAATVQAAEVNSWQYQIVLKDNDSAVYNNGKDVDFSITKVTFKATGETVNEYFFDGKTGHYDKFEKDYGYVTGTYTLDKTTMDAATGFNTQFAVDTLYTVEAGINADGSALKTYSFKFVDLNNNFVVYNLAAGQKVLRKVLATPDVADDGYLDQKYSYDDDNRLSWAQNDTNLTGTATVTNWGVKWNAYAVAADGKTVTKLAVVVDDGVATIKVPAFSTIFVYDGMLKNVKAAAAEAPEVTNPGTGANDVVGVAAALAVVALVSGAAISLKK